MWKLRLLLKIAVLFTNGSVNCGFVWGGDCCFHFSRSCSFPGLGVLFLFPLVLPWVSGIIFRGFVCCSCNVSGSLLPCSFSSLCMSCTQRWFNKILAVSKKNRDFVKNGEISQRRFITFSSTNNIYMNYPNLQFQLCSSSYYNKHRSIYRSHDFFF
jgi:hypothetical protein